MENLIWVHELSVAATRDTGGAYLIVPPRVKESGLFPELNRPDELSIELTLYEDGQINKVLKNNKLKDGRRKSLERKPEWRLSGELITYLKQLNNPEGVTLGFYKNINGNICFEIIHANSLLNNIPKIPQSHKNSFSHIEMNSNEESFLIDLPLAKPFILLAGISGTGKTRYVRKQAEAVDPTRNNYCLVSVRPDWHEPSDLLGYISRLNEKGSEFIVTDVVKFMVKAWLNSLDSIVVSEIDGKETYSPMYRSHSEVKPHWLCLDEMNLAPVEQYFADYLSILETRKWGNNDSGYSCDALLSANLFSQLEGHGLTKLRKDLGLHGEEFDQAWNYFQQSGICIPFNLIVAGTVNMDETTHGFSRKVIDRALTFDFGEFFPNNYEYFFTPKCQPKVLGFSAVSAVNNVTELNHVAADNDGAKSIAFLKTVNDVLKGTSFELAFRALNELLVSLHCFAPTEPAYLQAVWDDFLMCKVLPRIEGDEDKLAKGDSNILSVLDDLLATQLDAIWMGDNSRPDLLSEGVDDKAVIMTSCRSKKKIEQMQQKLNTAGFTSYWP
jgi:hypothetical protein